MSADQGSLGVEPKVSAQALVGLAATAGSGLLAWVDAVVFYHLPNTAEGSLRVASILPVQHLAVFALIPTAAGYYAGWRARHQVRQVDIQASLAAAGVPVLEPALAVVVPHVPEVEPVPVDADQDGHDDGTGKFLPGHKPAGSHPAGARG